MVIKTRGIAEIKRDVDVNSDDVNSRNLILLGNANTNAIIAETNDKIPLQIAGNGISADGQKLSGAEIKR